MKVLLKVSIFLIITAFQINAQINNIRVSKPSSTTPEEVTIAINPVNPNELAAGANISYFYQSVDGGQVWKESKLNSTLGVWGDPCVVYDTEGSLYFAHLSNPVVGYWIDRIVVQKSENNGNSWNDGVGVGYRQPKNQDKEWLAVDVTNSPYRNNIYMTWTEFDDYGSNKSTDSSRIQFSKSSDGGIVWSEPITISDSGGNCIDSDETVEGAVPAVGPDGEIYVSWAGPKGLIFDKSTDGGNTFGKDIFVSDIPGGWDFDIPGISRANGLPITACDISRSQYRGNVYIMWSDQRNGEQNTDIFFVKSTDKGETWSNSVRVNNDATSRQQFFVWMALDSTNGNIYAVFYDRRNTRSSDTEVYIARSADGGETFTNHKISESSFIPVADVFFGDYTNIAAYKGKIYPIWMRMDDRKLSVWTAIIEDTQLITSVEKVDAPNQFTLFQNYPNPFNPSTTIGFALERSGNVKILIFNSLGERINVLTDRYYDSGNYELNFDASGLASGIYLYEIITSNFIASRKMVYLR